MIFLCIFKADMSACRYHIILLAIFFIVVIPLYTTDTYTVRQGDTLSRIAYQNNLSVAELKALNGLTSDRIRIGQRLIVKKSTDSPHHYTVRAGDTLTSIARRNNTTVAQLIEWNELKSSNIRVNQRLIVGYETEKPPVPLKPPTYHIVTRGETLTAISRNYNVDVIDLVEFNKLSSFMLTTGQKIWLEDGHMVDPAPEPPPAPTTENMIRHTVRSGETLYRIGRHYGVTVDNIRLWNRLSSNTIRAGQVLVIYSRGPVSGSTGTVATGTTPRVSEPAEIPPTPHAILPVSTVRILSEFGIRNGRNHKGIDFGGAPGTPIYAVMDGTVVFSGRQGGYGNVVIIEHEGSIMTVYGHNESNLVRVGERVNQGQEIARMGKTGNATAYHVHFEYRLRGSARNPRELLFK